MESTCVWEQKTIINEITQGMELAKQLRFHLNSQSSPEARESLIQSILHTYDKALMILKWNESSGGQPQGVAPPMPSLHESSISIDESPRSGDFDQTFNNQQDQKVVCKKRKAMATWTDQVRICTDNGLEGNTDDGYSWRKYGQKDILGARFPRSYYRCTYRNVQNCLARKQVQRTDEDPTVFEITYKGKHTCNHAAQSVPQPSSPEKHEMKQNHYHHQQQQQYEPLSKSGEILSNLRANLRVYTSESDATIPSSFSFPSTSFGYIENYQQFPFPNHVEDDLLKGYSPSFISPATSGSNYFTEWGNDLQHHNDLNLTGIVSATASTTNSPLAFPADPTDLDPNFPFNNPGFFT